MDDQHSEFDKYDLLAQLLEEEEEIELLPAQTIARRGPDGSPPGSAPLSFAQQRLWFLDQLTPGSPLYNIPSATRLRGELDRAALERSVNLIIERHEALRSSFPTVDGRPAQVIDPTAAAPLPLLDLAGLPDAEREASLRRAIADESQQPFDLARGPLLRAQLVRLDEQEHVLLVTMHHIVSDGWSVGVFEQELQDAYNALAAGRAPALPELPIQYADFAAWQRQWLQGAELERQLAYWKNQLAGAPPVLALPADRPRPPVRSYRGTYQPLALDAALVRALRELSQREGATLFMTLLAAWAALLGRYADQDDVVIGSPIAGRAQRETEGLIGFFINTLVLRADLGGDPSFRALLGRVREAALGAYDHQDLPFEQLMEALQPPRNMSHPPLFQVMFALQPQGGAPTALSGLSFEPLRADTATAKFDLTLSLAETDEGARGILEYNTDIFEAATILRMIGHFQALLERIAADPDRPLSAYPLVTEAEERQLLDWAELERGYPAGALHELFEARAAQSPAAIAVAYEGRSLTYGELNARANQLARHLRGLGVGPETLVGLCLERSPELIVAILGILKAGGAYLPLDLAYPRERIQFMLEDSQAPALLTQSSLADQLPGGAARVVLIDADWPEIARQPVTTPESGATAESLAYVIYTSGSTGKPKGVLVPHGQVARLFSATAAWFDFNADDVWTMFHSVAFDFSVWEIWGALLYGGRLVVVPYLTSRSPEAFYQLLLDEGVTFLNQTPSAFSQLMRVDGERAGPAPFALRAVVFGGEALDLQSLRPWIERYGDQQPRLINMYGITETTVHVTYRPISAAEARGGHGSLIGRPIPDLNIYVLDRARNLAPVGVPGELYVGGAGVARGYLNRPELSAERFIASPFDPDQRLYRTGDLARYLPDGGLEYLGRIDQQVKIRGFRIELGEIEAVLKAHPALREAVVLARGEGGGDKRLIAYLVAQPGQTANVSELRRFAGARLPEYMVPSAFVTLAELPLTRNGKVDLRALPLPGGARPELEEAYAAPETPAEELLAGIWASVLGIEQVGVRDNFFALGGDSIRSVRVLALAKQKGLQFSLPQLFQHQTIRELAREAKLDGAASAPASAPQTQPFGLVGAADRARLPADLEDAYPLTRLQTGMLYHMQLHADEAVYHNVDSFHIRGRFDLGVFREAVQQVVARHPILRTSFDLLSYSEPLQLVHPRAVLPLGEADLRHLGPDEQQAALDAFRESERRRHFDLARPPLLRFFIHRRTDETFQFTLTECHAILDGWSLTSILAEMFNLHYALLDGEQPPEEPPLSLAFRDFVALEREALASAQQREFWARQLDGHSVMKLPRWPGAAAPPGGSRISSQFPEIPLAVSQGLQRLALDASVPLKSVLMAAHFKVMSLLSGQRDLTTGLVCNGRPEEIDGERIRGLFLNTVPFRQRLAAGSWRDLAVAAFEHERELLPFRRYPLAEMQQAAGGQPLFETLFNFVRFHALEGLVKSGKFDMLDFEGSEETNFTLFAGFGVNLASNRVTLHLDLDAAELTGEQIAAITQLYLRVLAAMAADPAARHDRAALLPEAELGRLLRDWNATAADYPRRLAVHQLVEAQAASTPEALAVAHDAGQLSYSELNRRANQLARRLREAGAGPETLIGVCMERTPELVVALLAILKAGAAYVPLDPAYPAERLQFMLADTAAPIILTQRGVAENLAGAAPLLEIDSERAALDAYPADNLGLAVDERQLAYVLYTSGSTGRPKGVAIEHRAAVNFLHWAGAAFGADELAGVLAATSINFDLSVFELFAPLSKGGAVFLAENALALPRLARAAEITLINTVPSAIAELARAGAIPAGARTINLAGEALPAALVRQLYALPQVRQVVNLYGPTEATTYATWTPLDRADERAPAIGRPLANSQAYLLDSHMQPVPAGAPGEVYIGGDGLACGYLNRPELTAEKFVPDPFGPPGARLYRTGDLARHLPDGNIEYLGRIDQQVKVRGFRIELGEIEAVLLAHPAVREAAVVAREDAPGDKRLVAYLAAAGPAPTTTELREHARAALPDYMVPAVFVTLPALPLTPNGKLDRKALPAPEGERPSLAAAYVAPASELEQALAGFWREALRLEQVGSYDNFFDLGGNSLALIRIHSKLCDLLQRAIPMTVMFKHTSISALARHLGAEQPAGGNGAGDGPPAPAALNSAQERARQQKAALQRQQQAGKGRKK